MSRSCMCPCSSAVKLELHGIIKETLIFIYLSLALLFLVHRENEDFERVHLQVDKGHISGK